MLQTEKMKIQKWFISKSSLNCVKSVQQKNDICIRLNFSAKIFIAISE